MCKDSILIFCFRVYGIFSLLHLYQKTHMKAKTKQLAFTIFIIVAGLYLGKDCVGQASREGDQSLSPYFFIQSEDASLDQMPLKSTKAQVGIAGVIADVLVVQEYKNEGKKPLEAIYVFPASTRAAVHHMRMKIGERIIEAKIKERQKARQEYETALKDGKNAALLEQQRPNVFQMNVGNIMPGDIVRVELEYTEILIPEDGVYSFVYPTVVGPRYSNQQAIASTKQEHWVANPYLKEGVAPLNTFEIECVIAAGLPLSDVKCESHDVDITYRGSDKADVTLKGTDKFQGNRDFILQYRLAGKQVETGILLYEGKSENFFLTMVQPPRTVRNNMIPKREYVFVLDVSGSMAGFPINISKKLMMELLRQLRQGDMFNILLFAGGSNVLSEKSLEATPENIARAQKFVNEQQGGGGTELLPALQKAFSLQGSENLSRSVVILTDGYVTVEKEAFELIRKSLNNANFFAFGIGTAVNRFLIEGMAHSGMGAPFFVTKSDEAESTMEKFKNYISTPVLTDLKFTCTGFDAYDIEPQSIPDVFSERPVVIFGKYRGKATGSITLGGQLGEETYRETIALASATPVSTNKALPYLWAREKIRFMDDFGTSLRPEDLKEIEANVTALGLKYNLLTKYTSFVAIGDEVRNSSGNSTTVNQPLPLPQGVSNLAVGNSSSLGKSTGGVRYPVRTTTDETKEEMADAPSLTPSKERNTVREGKGDALYCVVEEMPEFPGGDAALKKFISENLRYPALAKEKGISGKVYVSFTVDKDGTVKDIKVQRGIGGGCNEEAIRIVKLMPKFKPGKQSGKTIACQMTLPIQFVLSTESKH